MRKEGPSLKKVTITDDRLNGGDASGASPALTHHSSHCVYLLIYFTRFTWMFNAQHFVLVI